MSSYYQIAKWSEFYETCRTVKVKSVPRNIPMSTSYLNVTHRLIVGAGADVLGVQFALLKLAAHMPKRGVFIGEAGPLTGQDLAKLTGIDFEVFKNGLRFLLRPQIGFLEFIGDTPEKLTPAKKRKTPAVAKDPVKDDQAETIYQAYPRKEAKQAALKAIRKALKSATFEELLEKTQRYAYVRTGEPMQFTPHPATWFNGKRYEECESSWRNSKPAPGVSAEPHGGGAASEYKID